MILEEATFEAYGYYPSDLKPQSNRPILALCVQCGKEKITTKRDYRYFCNSCSENGGKFKTGENNHNFGRDHSGKNGPFFGKHHTVEAKARMSGKNNHNYNGGKVKYICQWCGKEKKIEPSKIKYGQGKYCSNLCARKAQRHNAKPGMTVPEKVFKKICQDNNLPFTFVGDGTLWIGNANPDFIHTRKKTVVEVFGDYWHSPLINRNLRGGALLSPKEKHYKQYRYKLIVIWESDLKRYDTEKFVLNLMKKEKII